MMKWGSTKQTTFAVKRTPARFRFRSFAWTGCVVLFLGGLSVFIYPHRQALLHSTFVTSSFSQLKTWLPARHTTPKNTRPLKPTSIAKNEPIHFEFYTALTTTMPMADSTPVQPVKEKRHKHSTQQK